LDVSAARQDEIDVTERKLVATVVRTDSETR